jgi:hypothetical protein
VNGPAAHPVAPPRRYFLPAVITGKGREEFAKVGAAGPVAADAENPERRGQKRSSALSMEKGWGISLLGF